MHTTITKISNLSKISINTFAYMYTWTSISKRSRSGTCMNFPHKRRPSYLFHYKRFYSNKIPLIFLPAPRLSIFDESKRIAFHPQIDYLPQLIENGQDSPEKPVKPHKMTLRVVQNESDTKLT